MRNLAFSLMIITSSSFASSSQWLNASQYYSKNSVSNLSYLKQSNPNDIVIEYFNAAANLSSNNPEPAVSLINKYGDDNYFSVDLMHQLLTYFFNNQSWKQYISVYDNLPAKQISVNETCGYDTANFALSSGTTDKSDYKWLINNKMPLWCISLVASRLNDGSLSKNYLQPFLNNLVNNEQTAQFNQLASTFNYGKVNFSASVPATGLGNRYQIIYRISNLAEKDPERAYTELANSGADKFTRQYMFNQVAANLAAKQLFTLAKKAIDNGNDDYLSDDEYEWRVRTYLSGSNWQDVLDTINAMPTKLQEKPVWLYWKAYALSSLGEKATAKQTLEKIPADFSYYSLLAQSELHKSPDIDATPPNGKLSSIDYANDASISFNLYSLGKKNGNANLVRLATQSLYYIISRSNDRDISIISKTALDMGWNEMSIYAGNKCGSKYASLSFPILFSQQYKRYSQSYNISMSYPMAVTRQESRFNPNALAADGGVGLMQIMPGTASYIAKKTGSSNCYKNYDCNIKFGSWYLGHLYDKFGNNLIYATAGYNAGPGRAHRWQQAFNSLDNRVQIELIPFKITRDYVQKVLTNKIVYDARLNNDGQVDLISYLNKMNTKDSTYIIDDDNNNGDGSLNQ